MSDMTNDSQRSVTANLALSKLVRNQAMMDRVRRPSSRDPMESFRKITARAAVANRTALIDAVAGSIAQTKLAPGIAALTKAQTGGLAAQLAGPKAAPGMEALTKALTAQMVECPNTRSGSNSGSNFRTTQTHRELGTSCK
jgi:hypothetical protein